MADTFLRAELLLDQDVTDAQERQLVSTLAELGVRTEVRRALAHRGPGELGWLVLLALPLHGFLSGLGDQAVKDLHSWVTSLLQRRSGQPGRQAGEKAPLVLHDSASGLRIVLEEDLPIEAYEQLVGLDLAAYQVGPLHYDRQRRSWRSELDEAAK